MKNPFKRRDGMGPAFRPSRPAPPSGGTDAASLRARRRRAHLPGPPGDIHTARTATDTWPAPKSRSGPTRPPTWRTVQEQGSRDQPMGGSDASG